MRMRGLLVACILQVGVVLCVRADPPVDPAALLFQTFNSRCASQGAFTGLALSDGNALEGILQTVVNDASSNCQGLRPVLDQITSIQSQLSRINPNYWNQDTTDLQQYEQKLTLMMSGTNDPSIQSSLASEIANVRIELAQKNLIQSRGDRASQQLALQQLSQYISLLRTTYPSQSLCFLNHPELPFQLTAHLLSLSGGFFNPIMGSALALSGDLFSDLLDLLQNQRIIDSIRSYRDDRMVAGLKCAAEALEDTLCSIRDEAKLIKVHDQYWNGKKIPKEWLGYEILYRDYPVVQNFLLRVEAGAQSQSQLQGVRHAEFRLEEGSFRATLTALDGLIGDTAQKLEILKTQPKSDQAQQFILRSLILAIEQTLLANQVTLNGSPITFVQGVPNVYNNVIPNPESSSRLEIFLRMGTFDPPDVNTTITGPYMAYLTKLQTVPIDFELLKKNLDTLNTRARQQLAVDQALVLNPDQQGTVVAWTFRTRITLDAGAAIKRIIAYFETLENDWSEHSTWFSTPEAQRDDVRYVENTRMRFQDVLDTLKDASISDSDKITKIFQIMDLEEEDQVITPRMHDIVETDLQIRLRAGLLANNQSLDNVIGLASTDAVTSLFPGAIDSLKKIEFDLGQAQFLAESNLDHFFDYFEDSLLKSFDLLWKSSKDWDPAWDSPQRKEIASLCILALNSSKITTQAFDRVREWCRPQVLAEAVGEKTIKVSFQDLMDRSKKDVSQRLCAYRDFINQVDMQKSLRQEHAEQDIEPVILSDKATALQHSAINDTEPKHSYKNKLQRIILNRP